MPQLTTIVPLTELDAVNAMLRSIGEAPITDVDTEATSRTDVAMAVDTLRQNIAKVQMRGWKFNTDFQWRIAVDGSNKFPVPSNLLTFKVTERSDQVGAMPEKNADGTFNGPVTLLDIVIRGGFFYNRVENKSDFGDATDRPQIFIDAVWTVDFTDCPESFRQFVTIHSARQFALESFGSAERSRFKEKDEVQAWNAFLRDQGNDRRRSMFDNVSMARVLGRRPFGGIII